MVWKHNVGGPTQYCFVSFSCLTIQSCCPLVFREQFVPLSIQYAVWDERIQDWISPSLLLVASLRSRSNMMWLRVIFFFLAFLQNRLKVNWNIGRKHFFNVNYALFPLVGGFPSDIVSLCLYCRLALRKWMRLVGADVYLWGNVLYEASQLSIFQFNLNFKKN